MDLEEIEAEVLKLDPRSRARLAEKLLSSLEELSDEENAEVWAAEAQRRDVEMDANPASSRPGEDVLRDARSRLR
jgi:hypothetical protein